MVMRRTFSVPAWWPARRGSPRRFAQRPFPSMMMPTWAGTRSGTASGVCSGCVPATRVTARLDLHDLGLFVPGHVVDPLDELVGQLLQPILSAPLVLLRDATILFGFAEVIEGVAAAVAHGNSRFLGAVVHLLDELFAPILGELR